MMIARSKVFLPLRARVVARPFSISRPRWEAAPLPTKKPVGAFRGGYVSGSFKFLPRNFDRESLVLTLCRVFGFLCGTVAASASVYYYVLGNYRISNEMLNQDISVRNPVLHDLLLMFMLTNCPAHASLACPGEIGFFLSFYRPSNLPL